MDPTQDTLMRKLDSQDVHVRSSAWDQIFGQWRDYLVCFFENRAAAPKDAEDLTQDVYLKLNSRLQKGPLKHTDNVGPYIRKTAERLLKDHRRQRHQFAVFDEEDIKNYKDPVSRTIEDLIVTRQDLQQVRDVYLGLRQSFDRVNILLESMGYTAPETGSLLPYSERKIYADRRRIHNYLRTTWSYAGVDSPSRSPWEQQLAFTGHTGPFGISIVNVLPKRLDPPSQAELCAHFDIDHFHKLRQVALPLLLVEGIKDPKPRLRVCFLPRHQVGWGIPEGRRIDYLEFTPVFYKLTHRGKPQLSIALVDRQEYHARMTERLVDEQGLWVGSVWHFYYPAGVQVINKAMDQLLLESYSNPHSQSQGVCVFQPAPLTAPPT